jgi:hypothetical protein
MAEILETVARFFEEDEWPFSRLDELSILQTGFQGENGQWNCFAEAREEQTQFLFYSVCPIHVPEDKRQATAEFLTRANFGLPIGNFEMDWDDGLIRCKTSTDVQSNQLGLEMVKQLVYANVFLMDMYLPGLMTVVYGDASPSKAVAQVEEQDLEGANSP